VNGRHLLASHRLATLDEVALREKAVQWRDKIKI